MFPSDEDEEEKNSFSRRILPNCLNPLAINPIIESKHLRIKAFPLKDASKIGNEIINRKNNKIKIKQIKYDIMKKKY